MIDVDFRTGGTMTATADGTAIATARTASPTTGPPLPGRPARRLQPPSWRDPRLVVGLLLVLGSVVSGGLVVRAADDTVPVYAAQHTLVPGQRLTADDVTAVRVRLPGLDRYLAAGPALSAGSVVLRTVGAGELVARSAVGDQAAVDLRPVAVPLDPSAARRLGPGVLVDVWVSERREGQDDGFAQPRRIASSVEVSATTDEHGALGSSTSSAAHLLLGPDLVPDVIAAVDNEARITLVPVPATVLDGRS